MKASIIAALVSGSTFLIGLVRAIQTHLFVRRAVRVRATVVGVLDASVSNPETSSQSAPTSRYVVEIVDRVRHKRRVVLTDAFGGSIADKFVANDGTIAVIYDPNKPGTVDVLSLHVWSAALPD